MKKFVQRFVPEYERILGMNYFTKHVINKRFLFLNGALLSTLGFIIFILIGWVFNLLDNRSYIFYGYNMIFIIVIFLLIYSTEVQRFQDVKRKYSISVMIISRLFTVLDGMAVMWGLMFFIFDIQLFTGLEGTIYNIVILSYLLFSIGLRRQINSALSGIPLTLLMGAMLLFFSALPMIIQYGISLLIVSILLYLKTNLDVSFFSNQTIRWLSFTFTTIVLLLNFTRDNDVIIKGFDPLGNTVVELSSNPSFTDTDVHLQYYGYSFATTYGEDYTTINIYDENFQLVESYRINTSDYLSLNVNFQNDRVIIFYQESVGVEQYRVLEIDSSLDLSDLGLMNGLTIENLISRYTIKNQEIKGDVVYQNLDYIITDPGSELSLNIYKRLNSSYEYQGQITRNILFGSHSEPNVRILHMIDDFFIFGRVQNDALLLYIANTSGQIVGGTYRGPRHYRGSETYFTNANTFTIEEVISSIYYEEDGTPVIYCDNLGESGKQLFEISTLYRSNLNVGWTTKNKTEIASILFLFGLLIPIPTREEN